jgi:cytochrome c peroxidase
LKFNALYALGLVACATLMSAFASSVWSNDEVKHINTLWLANLEPLTPNPSNRYADNTTAARLGQRLFFDPGLSANEEVSCASCHDPEFGFADNKPVSEGLGKTDVNAPTVVGAAYSPWQFWNGRADSLWAQALGPLEHPKEMGGNRLAIARYVTTKYANQYKTVFGAPPEVLSSPLLPDAASPSGTAAIVRAWTTLESEQRDAVNRVFVNVGKALEAYQRRLIHSKGAWSRFDAYAEALMSGDSEARGLDMLTATEEEGLRLFIGKAGCTECHSGPRLTDDGFHDTGFDANSSGGRSAGIKALLGSEFTCASPYSDAQADLCQGIRALLDPFTSEASASSTQNQDRAFRTSSLRNLVHTAPYGVDGRYQTLRDILEVKNNPPVPTARKPLGLTNEELDQLEAFLKTLDTPIAADPSWLAPLPQ